jgi:hypothetical protein
LGENILSGFNAICRLFLEYGPFNDIIPPTPVDIIKKTTLPT